MYNNYKYLFILKFLIMVVVVVIIIIIIVVTMYSNVGKILNIKILQSNSRFFFQWISTAG